MDDDGTERKQEKPNIEGDKLNIVILLFLYALQGGTAGLTQAFPIILQNRKVSYADQAEFSVTGYPFSFKLLWAPIVDCVYSRRMGRRKTWLIPMQYLIGLSQLYVSMSVDGWLGSEDGAQKPRIRLITLMFFLATLFNSIQDVALDSWSLTLLQRRNVGYSGVCQHVGGTTGMLSTYTLLILLDSKEFCNKFRAAPQNRGFVNLADFIFYWSMLVLVSTTLIFVFKKENGSVTSEDDDCEPELSLKEGYGQLWKMLKLRPIITLSLVLLTCRVGFGPLNGVAALKVIEAGVTRDNYVLLTTLTLPFQMILSVVLRRQVAGRQSMHAFLVFYVLKLIVGILLAVVLFVCAYARDESKVLPIWLYCVLLFVFNLRNIIKYLMSLSLGTFFYRVSDPRYGATYVTLWGSIVNIGIIWPVTLSLWCVDWLTMRRCVKDDELDSVRCYTKFDGFYAETVLCAILGAVWLCWGKKVVYELEKLDASAWIVERKKGIFAEEEKSPVLS